MSEESPMYGVGLDIGTMNIVSARQSSGKPATKRIRDAFLDLPKDSKKMLRLSSVPFFTRGEELLVLGDEALGIANMFGREARRPLSDGLISNSEIDAHDVLRLLIENVLGEPSVEGEHCYFSVPAAPVDEDRDVIYHTGVFTQIVSDLGYEPHASNEAMAIIFSDCAKDGFSGLAFSFGAGMTNVALAMSTIEGLSFSVARGGDWIDSGAAKSMGSTQAKMTAVKEKGVNLMDPQGREQQAIAFYYQNLISYALQHVAEKFKEVEGKFLINRPIPIVVSGGTSRAEGFLDLFKKVFDSIENFPFEISEVRAASDQMNAVALGMMIQAAQEYVEDDDE